MELIPTVISAGYAAGLNAYGTVALLGLLGRAGFGEVPEPLQSDGIIIGSAVMYAIEFVTDKVPYLDNAWDAVHTLVRPAIGSAIGVEFAEVDQAAGATEALAGAGGGATALTSHAIKAGVRLGINASPEPFSNIFVSLAEDGIVAGVIALVLKEPLVALAVVVVLIAIGIGLVLMLRAAIRRALAKRRERRGPLIADEDASPEDLPGGRTGPPRPPPGRRPGRRRWRS